jgi:hypothetical protein
MKNIALILVVGLVGSAASGAETSIQCRLTAREVSVSERIEIAFDDAFGVGEKRGQPAFPEKAPGKVAVPVFRGVENADDPRQADVQGVFVSPSGVEQTMPGFLYQDFERVGEEIVPRGKPQWRVRFTPDEPGRWTARVQARVGGKTFAGEAGTFEALPAKARGFLRRSKTNPLALEFQNGEPLIAIGSNVFPGMKLGQPVGAGRALDVIRYLERTAKAGGTFCRFRMDSWFIPIEMTADEKSGYFGPGRYDPQACWEVDRIIEAAERLGITLMLCISNANANVDNEDTTRPWRLRYNFYLEEHGGPLESNEDFWTDPEVKRLFSQKIRYSVARWGASPAIGVWEFFNEVKLNPEKVDEILDWHNDLAAQWRAMDPYKRPVATSPVGGYSDLAPFWRLAEAPELDLVQYHSYKFTDLAMGLSDANLRVVERADRPLIVGEFGTSKQMRLKEGGGTGSDSLVDPTGLHMHNGMWASIMSGAAGALPWFISNHIDPGDLYWRYTGLARFAADWNINAAPWRPVEAGALADVEALGDRRWGEFVLPAREAFERRDKELYIISRDGSTGETAPALGFLWGIQAHRDLRLPPIFEVDYPVDGRFVVIVDYGIGKEGSRTPVSIELDGREVAREVLDIGKGRGVNAEHMAQYDNWRVTFDREIAIDVPAGKHRVRVEAEGTDRTAVRYRLTNYLDRGRQVYRVWAMGLDDRARLWIQNRRNTFANHYYAKPPTDAPPATVRVALKKPGRYTAEWWDTVKGEPTGRQTVEAGNGFAVLEFPGTLSDAACRIVPTAE